MNSFKYTTCKSSRVYDGGTWRGEFDSYEEARASADDNPVGFDVYRVGSKWPTREIRADMLNMSSGMWDIYNSDPRPLWAADEFLDIIGLPGGCTTKATLDEIKFFDEIYLLYREKL